VKGSDALRRLRDLDHAVLTTGDAAAALGISIGAAHQVLRRLTASGLVASVARGLWSLRLDVDPLVLADALTAPLPAYVSLQTALHLHGIIEQIPARIFVVSLGRTRLSLTRFGCFSIHRMAPEVFGGFIVRADGAKIATAEKALFDVIYLSATRQRSFASLPELELPPRFDRRAAVPWIARIASPSLQTMVHTKWRRWVGSAR
jgi:predicted transcriptional regulator of viral defense system